MAYFSDEQMKQLKIVAPNKSYWVVDILTSYIKKFSF